MNKIKKYTMLFAALLFGLLLSFSSSFGQTKIKPTLYLFFEENAAKGMYKITRKSEAIIRPKKKINIPEYEYDIYTYQYTLQDTTRRRRYKLQSLNKNNYCIRDSSFMKRNVKKFEVLKNIHYDIFDHKNFPYSRVFIVEYISANQFKVIQVSTYLGTDY
jgi:hypothetical protein